MREGVGERGCGWLILCLGVILCAVDSTFH